MAKLSRGKWAALAALLLLALLTIGLFEARRLTAQRRNIDTPKKKLSYAMGVAMARNARTPGVALDQEVLERGLHDGLAGGSLLIPEAELRATVSAFQAELKRNQAQAARAAAETNSAESAAFFAQNGKEQGVVTLPSGLQYKILTAGNGNTPGDDDSVEVRYRSTRLDGHELQNSDGNSTSLLVSNVIPGLSEGVKLMPVGSKWRLFVPGSLGYGERGMPDTKATGRGIGPNEALIIELELLTIRPAVAKASAGQRRGN